MKKLLQYLLIEWKLLFRGISFVAVMAAVIGLFYLSTMNGYRANDLGWYVSSMLYFYLSPLLLLAQFFAVSSARRDIAMKTHLLVGSLPFQSWQLIGARVLALIIPFSIFALFPLAFFITRGLLLGISTTTIGTGIPILMSYFVPMIFTIVLAYGIGALSGKRISYLISFIATLFFIIVARLLLAMFLPPHWVHIGDMALSDLYSFKMYSELWGFNVDVSFWLHRLFYSGIILLVVSYILYTAMKNRKEKHGLKAVIGVMLMGLLISMFSLGSYASVWSERVDQYNQRLDFYQEKLTIQNPHPTQKQLIQQFLVGEISGDTSGDTNSNDLLWHNPLTDEQKQQLLIGEEYRTLAAQAYDLKLTTGAKNMLYIEGSLKMTHESEQAFNRFPISLRHVFTIDEMKINGTSVGFEWEPYRDVVWIIPVEPIKPLEMFDLSFSYSGQIEEWYLRKNSRIVDDHWERRIFVDKDKLFLPSFYGWYPQPGNHTLGAFEKRYYSNNPLNPESRISNEIVENRKLLTSADFQVTVNTNKHMNVITNGKQTNKEFVENRQKVTFIAKSASDFDIIGGDISIWTASNQSTDVSVILSNQVREKVTKDNSETILAYYGKLYEVILAIKPDIMKPSKIVFVRADYPGRNDFRISFLNSTVNPNYNTNRIYYLPFATNLALMTKQDMRFFNIEILVNTLLKSGELTELNVMNENFWYLVAIINNYVDRSLNREIGPLFDTNSNLINGELNPVYANVNKIYEKTGHEQFFVAIQEIYQYLKDAKIETDYRQASERFIELLADLAGEIS